MSWGQNLEGFNNFLFNHLPFYNKFRAPSMIMVIPQLLLPALAVLCVNKIITDDNKAAMQKLFMRGLIATGGIFALLLMMYFSFDFLSSSDQAVLKQVRSMNQPQLLEYVQSFYNGLKDDRKSMMLGDIFRSLGFVLAAAALVYLFVKNMIKPWLLIAGLSLFSFIDLMMVNSTYLNKDSYKEKEEEEAAFTKTAKDEQILQDKTDYRVFNMTGNAFSENNTSYLYKSAGGYHAAKLRLYQDLIERQLSKQQPNMAVFNMLNVKYFIQKNNSLTQNFQQNPGALGSAWLVKNIQFVKDADAEMKALDNFNPKDTAFVQDAFKTAVPFMPETDSTASIKLIKNDNDIITYDFSSTKNQFAVFSEIYYKAGWKAFANGKELPIAKVNYVLRGLALTPGKYTIEFKFEPQGYLTGKKMDGIANLLMGLILLLLPYAAYKWFKKTNTNA
jgi:Bacterial membrane protein YfhO